MAADNTADMDTLGVIAAIFWIAGSVLTFVIAVKVYNRNCAKMQY